MGLDALSKDVAKLIASYAGNFFSLSSVNRRFRRFFQSEREAALKKVKIFLKENGESSFLLTFEGKLYACGQNSTDHFGFGDKKYPKYHRNMKCYKQWTQIGPRGSIISEVVLADENSVFVRCDKEWFGAGSHPYIQKAQRRDKSSSPWVKVLGPEPFSIRELIPTETGIFILGKDGFCYAYKSDTTSSKISWEKIGSLYKKIEEILVVKGRIFLRCTNRWYGSGENKHGELGLGFSSDSVSWRKMGPSHKKVLQLKANQFNTFVYCDDENWYGCGKNDHGQLGTGDRENRLYWVNINPENKKVNNLFVLLSKTFAKCGDELYLCGDNETCEFLVGKTNAYDYLNWHPLTFKKQPLLNALNVVGNKAQSFIQTRDGWYGQGEDEKGMMGRGYYCYAKNPKKLNCRNKKIINMVVSQENVFACCEDGWYFTGWNRHGQNGLNDRVFARLHWVKVLSHGEEIEQAAAYSFLNKNRIKNDPIAPQFRRALKNLYDPYFISMLETIFIYTANCTLHIGFHPSNEDQYCFYFFLSTWDFNNLYDSEVGEIPGKLRSVIEFPFILFLAEDHFNGGGFPWHLHGSQRKNYPFPLQHVSLEIDNHAEICRFLESYERMLDEYELGLSEKSDELRFRK